MIFSELNPTPVFWANLKGSRGNAVANAIQSALDNHTCPLCGTAIASHSEASALSELKKLDRKLADTRAQLDEALKTHNRTKKEASGSVRGVPRKWCPYRDQQFNRRFSRRHCLIVNIHATRNPTLAPKKTKVATCPSEAKFLTPDSKNPSYARAGIQRSRRNWKLIG